MDSTLVEKKQTLEIIPIEHQVGKYFFPKNENQALFLAALLAAARAGHLCVRIDSQEVFPSFGTLNLQIQEGATCLDGITFCQGKYWYLKRYWDVQNQFYQEYQRIENQKVAHFTPCRDPKLSTEQWNALEYASKHPLTILSGGPGTGKTFTASKLISSFLKAKIGEVALAAPTGKAASHLKNALGDLGKSRPHYTLHRLLTAPEIREYALIVVDEGSMIDAELMARLFKKISPDTRLFLIGDRDQLPPVETGHLFRFLAQSKHCTSLTQSRRTDRKEILETARFAKEGKEVPFEPLPTFQKLLDELIQKFSEIENGTSSWDQFRVLSALKKGPYGTEILNEAIAKKREEQGKSKHPIMIIENDHYLDLANGDCGIIENETLYMNNGKSLSVWQAPKFTYAYVLSIHKSQGSEYNEVWTLIPPGSDVFGRELLYTALTRARMLNRLFSSKEILKEILAKKERRLSGLEFN